MFVAQSHFPSLLSPGGTTCSSPDVWLPLNGLGHVVPTELRRRMGWDSFFYKHIAPSELKHGFFKI